MAQKIVGYTELEWVCPNCSTHNPGPDKTCNGCGAPQPKDVRFQQRRRDELITDEDKIAAAIAGADIHCPFCGTRNKADAEVCINCGGELEGGHEREEGQVLGAFQSGPASEVTCPHCGSLNPDTAYNCSNCGGVISEPPMLPPAPAAGAPTQKKKMSPLMIGLIGIGVIALCAILIFLFNLFTRTTDTIGQVAGREWQRSVVLEHFGPVNRDGWAAQIPSGARVGTCEMKYHHTQDFPAPDSREICGTPYTKDTGSGYGQVVQDCKYEVYEKYCNYTIDAWSSYDTLSVSGFNDQSYWPETNLTQNQRYGEQSEQYKITFSTDDGTLSYSTNDVNVYNAASVGSKWLLQVNAFGGITSIEPR